MDLGLVEDSTVEYDKFVKQAHILGLDTAVGSSAPLTYDSIISVRDNIQDTDILLKNFEEAFSNKYNINFEDLVKVLKNNYPELEI